MEITAEFCQKPLLEVSKLFESKNEMDVEKKDCPSNLPTTLPFQVQIKYTALNGQQCLRVITKTRELTDNAEELEDKVDITVVGRSKLENSTYLLGMHANVKTATLAQQGRFEEVLQQQRAYDSVMSRNISDSDARARYRAWNTTSADFAQNVQQQQIQQMQQPHPHSAYATDDATSNHIYRQRNARSNAKQWGKERKY